MRQSETAENIALPDITGAINTHRLNDRACRAVSTGTGSELRLFEEDGLGRKSMTHESRSERVRVKVLVE